MRTFTTTFRGVLRTATLTICALIPMAGSAEAPSHSDKTVTVFGGKQSGQVAHQKISPRLTKRLEATKGLTEIQKAQVTPDSDYFVRFDDSGRVQVYIEFVELDNAQLDWLAAMECEVEIANQTLNIVQAWIHPDLLETLADNKWVKRIYPPRYAQPNSGSVTSEGDGLLLANQVRELGITGAGVKVGVISDGANDRNLAQASGDLPQQITVFGSCSPTAADFANCFPSKTCNEGTALLEIVHDLAPDAELGVAAVSTTLEFVQAVDNLIDNFGADIIVDDLGFFGEPYFENGFVASSVQTRANEVLFISAAGNYAQGHYEADFQGFFYRDGDLHNFGATAGGSNDASMNVVIQPGQFLITILQWSDPFGASSNDYDLLLVNTAETDPLCLPGCISEEIQDGNDFPIEAICYFNDQAVPVNGKIGVEKFSGADRRIELFLLGGGTPTEYNRREDSIFGHSGLAEVLTVGTINADDPGTSTVAFYSSEGPSSLQLPTPITRPKPDITGIDGVSVTGAGGFPTPFFGTSAAAPHIAGLAALLLSVPGTTRESVAAALTSTAVDIGAPGFDNRSGFGRADAAAALQAFDADADGVIDSEDNCVDVVNSDQTNSDNDSLGDACDADDDNDGVADADDAFPTDPSETLDTDGDGQGNNADPDDDGDGLPDTFEAQSGLDPLDPADSAIDSDSDGLTNLQEYEAGTNINNPDSDNDGTSDGDEVASNRNPLLNEAVIIQLIGSDSTDESL